MAKKTKKFKIKSHTSAAKRLKVTKNGKIMKRRAGQNHYNAKDSGAKSMRKRKGKVVSKANRKALQDYFPYN